LGYLTSFLNSKLFKFTFKDDFPELLGETRELRKVFFENISVKPIDDDTWFTEKIEQIVYKKVNGLQTEHLENEIDEMIFSLYKLTDSERAIVSGNVSPSVFSEESINLISFSDSE
jgi:adenine-specific DNA-methyltransferase